MPNNNRNSITSLEYLQDMFRNGKDVGHMDASNCIQDTNLIGGIDESSLAVVQNNLLYMGSLETRVDKAQETLPVCLRAQEPAINALLESMDNKGFLLEPIETICETYSQIFEEDLNPSILEEIRTELRDNGPTVGMLSKDMREYRACIAKHITCGNYEQSDFEYGYAVHKSVKTLKEMVKNEGLSMQQLRALGEAVAARTTQSRALTPGVTKRLMGCSVKDAELLCRAYHVLPATPID